MNWDVVVTAKAPEIYIRRFVQHYLTLGVSTIHLYYDDPAVAFPVGDPRVRVTICDADYWRGNRDRAVEARQLANTVNAVSVSSADWMLHCDIDEYLDAEGAVDGLIVARARHANASAVSVPPAEPLYTEIPRTLEECLGARYFKTKGVQGFTPSKVFWTRYYGDLADMTTAGYWANRLGKSFVRVDVARAAGIHLPLHCYTAATASKYGIVQCQAVRMRLRHFDAMPVDMWMTKHVERCSGIVHAPLAGDRRNKLARLVADTFQRDGRPGLEALYRRMFCIAEPTLSEALRDGYLQELPPLPPVSPLAEASS